MVRGILFVVAAVCIALARSQGDNKSVLAAIQACEHDSLKVAANLLAFRDGVYNDAAGAFGNCFAVGTDAARIEFNRDGLVKYFDSYTSDEIDKCINEAKLQPAAKKGFTFESCMFRTKPNDYFKIIVSVGTANLPAFLKLDFKLTK